jgi:diguanylate cyclase (GGDEF)-like protein
MRVHRLQTRIIVLFVALLALVQVAAFWLVNAANSRNAHAKVEEELIVGERVFARVLDQSSEKLSQTARVLAADFPFREAIGSHDTGTIASALANHGARIGANAMLFVDLDRNVVWDTLHPGGPARKFELPELLGNGKNKSGSGLHVVDGHAFQLVAVPVLAPVTIGGVVMGFSVDDELARDLSQLTGLEVSFALEGPDGTWQLLASTAPKAEQQALIHSALDQPQLAGTRIITIDDVDYQTRVIPLGQSTGVGGTHRIVAVLDRSLASALAAFGRLRNTLIVLAVLSLLFSIVGSVAVARNITRPLKALASTATDIERGDYSREVHVERSDEIGVLAASLNHMRSAIADRDQRNLKLAYEDPLTDLANRSRFNEYLERALQDAGRSGRKLSILVMDLDRFKYVNDTLGHGVGDHVLREVSRRLLQVVATADCVARLGGDEFALLMKAGERADFSDTARAIIAALETPILYEGQPLDVGTSIGIAHFPEHGADAQTLVRNADIAMYVAKRNKTGFATYDPNYDSSQQEHLSLLGELRRAVEQNELRLHYQPKVSLHSANVSAVEALLRWEHPVRGVVNPALFVPFAEHTGYIKVLTRWVMREAIRQCGAWLKDGLRLQVAINISARDLMNRDLPDQVAALLAEHQVPANLVCLEITESGFMDDPAHAQKVLDRLAALGLQLSIDDYGTGYSSLSYIMRLPVQELKIDRSFISRMVGNSDISTIVRSTIELGHNLGLKVVAEGVEDAASWSMLQALGCDDAQGYFMSRPLDPRTLEKWMRDHDGAFPAPSTGTMTMRALKIQLGD